MGASSGEELLRALRVVEIMRKEKLKPWGIELMHEGHAAACKQILGLLPAQPGEERK